MDDKNYSFDEGHDHNKPADVWFQDTQEGKALFIVFYSQACRWSRCIGCNLPSLMSERHVDFESLMAQVDHIISMPEVAASRAELRKVIVSNNGSVLDEATFSSTALMYLVARLNQSLPNLSVLSLETRPEYVDIPELEFLARALKEGACHTNLEIAIGFEAFDERIRNDMFKKGLSLKVFEKTAALLAEHRFALKCYFMLKPTPGLTDEEAVGDIHAAIDYLGVVGASMGLPINMHLNPTYVARGTALERSFDKGEFSPPRLRDLARAAFHAKGKGVSIYLGLSDEGLACEGGSFVRKGEEAMTRELERFNRTGDFAVLENIINGA
ncbi:MAG: hypothetical protein OEZ04_02985 [Nitrospinota bacterium]|nr:hypothetical protein [Nitrospinota bacterium]